MITAAIVASLLGQSPVTVNKVRTIPEKVLHLVAAPTGPNVAASMEDFTVRLINAGTGATVRKFAGHPQPVYGMAFNRLGTILATGDETGRIWLWKVADGTKLKEFTRSNAHTRGIQALNFSPDGKMLASTGRDDVIILWDVASGKPVRKIDSGGNNVASGVFNSQGNAVYAATLGQGLALYLTGGGTKPVGGHKGLGCIDFASAPGGTKGISGGKDNQVIVWDLSAKKALKTFTGHEDWVIHVAIAPNGRLGASSSNDRTVRLWDTAKYTTLGILTNQSAVGAPLAFTADGRFLVSANVNDEIQINSINPPQAGAPAKPASNKRRR